VKIGGEEMKYAIIRSGGKQYKAVPGEIIQVDKLPVDPGKKVVLNEVLFIADGAKKVNIGTPLIKGAKVETTVADQIKGPKILVFKYKPKVRYRRRQGHRQKYTLLKVDTIVAGTTKAASSKKAETTKKAASTSKTATKKPASTKKASTKKTTGTAKTSTKKAASTAKTSTKKTTSKKSTGTKATTSKSSGAKSTGSTKTKASKKAGDKDGS
jgi:large subunit ribosomal protein L21